MFKRWRKKPEAPNKTPVSAFSTDAYHATAESKAPISAEWEQPIVGDLAADSSLDGTVPAFKGGHMYGIPEAQASWYLSQTFIGYSMCASIARHWLVDKAITMPARDALRQGYRIDGEGDLERLEKETRERDFDAIMREYVSVGRTFGGAAALFVVESTDPEYYEKPFNPDGVLPGQYKGVKIIEPSWITPELTSGNVQDPASLDFYRPTFWRIGSRRYHRSHLCFYTPHPVSNLAKNTYRFFGVSVPERIYERVYAAERTANEAPQLALTKRLLTLGVAGLADSDKDVIAENMAYFLQMRDNYGVQIGSSEDTFQQFDTALADLDVTIMTQYQLVAAAANVPATKLLGTTPKGFNSTGEYEEASYREELESIQTNDLEPLLSRHLELLSRSLQLDTDNLCVVWEALDSPTAKEYAEINSLKAQAAAAYASIGAIDGEDVRKQLAGDRNSEFYGLESAEVDISGWLNDETDQEAGAVGAEPEERQASGQAFGLPGFGEPTV